MSTLSGDPARIPVQHARLQESVASGTLEGWDAAWKENWTPWDASGPQIALEWAFKCSDIVSKLPTGPLPALVPGMGRGYDTAFLAEQGYSPVVGVDISNTAVQAATAWRDANVKSSEVCARIQLYTEDFFSIGTDKAFADIPRSFSLAYDYTFLCALHPSMRKKWAETYARVIQPGGILLALVYPIEGDRPGGPPFSLSPDIYEELLRDSFDLVWSGIPGEQSERRKNTGIEQVQVWKRR